jgi:predicted anti-sigma-YlaC factor YlaD
MITCSEAKASLWDYYDQEGTAEQRRRVEEHLADCTHCRASLDEWVYLSQRAFQKRDLKAPPFLWTRVLAAIESEEEARGKVWWAQWRWMAQVAAVTSLLVSLGAGLVFYQTRQSVSLEMMLQGATSPQMVRRIADEKDSASWAVSASILGPTENGHVTSGPVEVE